MASKAFRLAVLLSAIATSPLLAQSSASPLVAVRHASDQTRASRRSGEGFVINPNGTCNLWFGYRDRNYEEAIDLPIGPDNAFEPGGDRGQPTHFTPRRHNPVNNAIEILGSVDHLDFNWSVDYDADFQRLVDERKAKLASTSRAQNR